MAVKVGKAASVNLAGNKVAEMGTFSISGFTREALEDTEFGDDVKSYLFGIGDGGEVSFSGNYSDTDTTGQDLLNAACSNGSLFGSGQLRFYIDSVSYWTIGSGGTVLITKCKAISFEKAGIGTIEFTGKLSGVMVLV